MEGVNFYKKANNILGWLVFLFAAFVYLSTMEKTGSFWDCGEFVSCALKLQVAHPPGAPFFNIIGRIFSLFAFGDPTQYATMINALSALSTAFVVLFGFWSTSAILRKVILKKEEDYSTANIIAILGSALVAGLSITFLDSLWFSAGEGEVYALSMFFMTFVFWATLKWDADDSPYADRWLLLIAFMIGLSSGVHLLSLLAIPFTALMYYLKRYEDSFSWKGLFIAFVLAFIAVGVVMKGIIAGIPSMYSKFEKLFVNSFGLPFNSGVIFVSILIILGLVGLLWYANNVPAEKRKGIFGLKLKNGTLERLVLAIAFVIVGYSSFLMVPIRSAANPPINMNRPTDAFKMLSYLNREQYGERPLISGPDYTLSPQDEYVRDEAGRDFKRVNKRDILVKGKDKYEIVEKDGKFDYVIQSDSKMLFPRLGVLNDPGKVDAYRAWIKPNYNVVYSVYDATKKKSITKKVASFKYNQLAQAEAYVKQQNESGENQFRYRIKDDISWGDNISYFFSYQMGFMYMRYFMWNFSGRQNDIQGTYANADGGWITGIAAVDDFLGTFWGNAKWTQKDLSKERLENKARNKFYAIPFILGIVGLIWLFKKNWKIGIAVMAIFLTTGMIFNVYGNHPPIEPRERDYVIVGSLFIYAMWLGMSVFAIFDFLRNKISGTVAAPIAIVVALIAPVLMGSEGWDDHNRDFRTVPVDMATNYLESCAPNAIIFTQGDNDTYPLWYAQEVEGIRTDIRVINVSLLGVDWYVNQLRYKMNDAAHLKLTFTPNMIKGNIRDYVPYVNNPSIDKNKYYNAKDIMKFISKDDPKIKAQTRYPYYVPTRKMSFPVSAEAVKTMNMTDAPDSLIVSDMRVDLRKASLQKNDLMTIDIIANNINDRPIYFAISVAPSAYLGFQKYFQQEGLTYRIVPVENVSGQPTQSPVRKELMYNNMMNKFKWGKIAENPNVYLDENILRMTQNLVSNFSKLAEEYQRSGDSQRAIEIVDKCLEVLPIEKVNPNYFHGPLPSIYLRAGEKEKAKALSDKIVATCKDELEYMHIVYKNEKARYAPGTFGRIREVQEYLYLLQQISRAYQVEDETYSKELTTLLNDYSLKFQQ
ncbi:MAG: DUF2723 domain-containing protein [Chitinophagales bacterium]